MAHYSFRKDVKEGELGEKFVTKCLCETYGATLLSENKTNSHDVIIQFPERPSGISVTQADVFVTYFKNLNQIWAIRTSDLKELLETYNFRTVGNAGDVGSGTCGYLIPRMQYKSNFVRYILPE